MTSLDQAQIDSPDSDAPAFLWEKATPVKVDVVKKLVSSLYVTSTGYWTSYPTYFQWQQASLWCWLAVAASLGNYRLNNNCAYYQSNLAVQLMGATYNQAGDPARSMAATSCFRGRMDGRPDYPTLLSELANNYPVVVGMDIGFRHVAVLSGIGTNSNPGYLRIDDPLYGPNQIISDECTNFLNGSWISTFFYSPR